jgi:hypothetical protein
MFGKKTLKAEITHISAHGMWLLFSDREYFLKYSLYPWFKEANISDLQNIRVSPSGNLHWPALDIDLELSSLQFPEAYPLIYRK